MPVSRTKLRCLILTLATLILGVLGAVVSHKIVNQTFMHAEKARFAALTEKITGRIAERVHTYEYGLRGARGVFAASQHVELNEFRKYMASRDVELEFPGSLGFGYIERVKRDNLTRFVEEVRADNAPNFTVRTWGDANELYVIRYIEPVEKNIEAYGLDIGAESNRRDAADRAMLTGLGTLTARITLVQDNKKGAGLLYLYPFYKPDSVVNTPDERRENLLGWAFTPVVLDLMMADVADIVDRQIDFEIFDGTDPSANSMLYDDDGHVQQVSKVTESHFKGRTFNKKMSIEVGGRTWTIWLSTRPEFDQRSNPFVVRATLYGGLLLSLLISGIVFVQGGSEMRARDMANEITQSLMASEAEARKLAAVASHTSSSVILTDLYGRIEWINEAFTRTTGYRLEDVVGKVYEDVMLAPESSPAAANALRSARSQNQTAKIQLINYTKVGHTFWFDLEIQPVTHCSDSKCVLQFMMIANDITANRQAATKLRESEARFRATIEAGFDAFYLFTAIRDDGVRINDFECVEINERGALAVDKTREQLLHSRFLDLFTSNESKYFFEEYIKIVETGTPFEVVHQDVKSLRWLEIQAVRVGDGVAVSMRNVTDRKHMEEQLRETAATDHLTALYNRSTFVAELRKTISYANTHPEFQYAVLFLDFDRFKNVNDTLGHDVGDALLIAIAGRLKSALRFSPRPGYNDPPSVVARYGGDEFVVITRSMQSQDEAEQIAGRLLKVLNRPYDLGEHEINSTASIGIATDAVCNGSAEELIKKADTAMYAAKTGGRNRLVVYTSDLEHSQSAA